MNYSKLAQLRAKTDSQLLTVIGRNLDKGFDFARHALHTHAEKVHQEARALLQVVNGLTPAERRSLESKVVRLGGMLGERTVLRVQTACY